eukprot:TRINITY_DN8972_c0_g1_i1.p1 TRINITY_DN8972_c0_g1~~TRINITY_DN8972_c0_g1_i1.p1  ORF type:complete len:639 (-),score=126.74 TRINITY_DN8972_c0_g1_i1:61-1977(-)
MLKHSSYLLNDCVVYVSGGSDLSRPRNDMAKLLALNGALVVNNINQRVTHVVCTEDDETIVIEQALENGVKLIKEQFFTRSIRKQIIVDENKYLLDDDTIFRAREIKMRERDAKIRKKEKEKKKVSNKKRKRVYDDEEEAKRASTNRRKGINKVVVKGKVPVKCENLQNVSHVYEDNASVPWSALLNQVNISNNNNKFYRLQLLESDVKDRYWVWTNWGRVGAKGSSKIFNHSDLNSAKNLFLKRYKQKTMNNWGDDFVPVSGYYTLIIEDFGAIDDKPPKKKYKKSKIPPSHLDIRIQDFVKTICNTTMMREILLEMNFDVDKMPLGKISPLTLSNGRKSLSKIEKLIKNDPGNTSKLIALSNIFYTAVPHNFGHRQRPPVIKSLRTVKKKLKLLEEMENISIAAKVIKEAQNTDDNPTDIAYNNLNCELTPVDETSDKFKILEDYVRNTHCPTHNSYKLRIVNAFKADRADDNEFESDIHNQQLLWHGSRLTNFAGIISQGLRIAPPEAPVTGYMFGKGLYFADMCSKSANYCHATRSNPFGILLLCNVALGEMYEKKEAEFIEKLPKGYDSTFGVGRTIPDPDQFDKDDDGALIPLGEPLDTRITDSALLYNEFVVYRTTQVKMRYLLKVEFIFK